jgi:hypothetical protein
MKLEENYKYVELLSRKKGSSLIDVSGCVHKENASDYLPSSSNSCRL